MGGKHRLTGSGRSVNGYPIIDFIHSAKDFATGGGHAAAAGISILEEDIQKLRERCNAHYRKWLEEHGKEQEVLLDCVCEIDFDVCNMRFAENLDKLEPYGKDNMPLVFVSKNVKIKDCMILGETGNAIRFTFSKDNIDVKGIGFSSIVGLYKDNMNIVDIAYNIGINEWMGKKSLQLTVLDIKPVKNKVVTEGWTTDLL